MDIKDTIYNRRSIRQYKTGFKVPEIDLHQILEAGMYAPSAMNKQPWAFLVISDPTKLKKIQELHAHAPFLCDAGTAIIVCNNLEKEYMGMGVIDVSLASQNMMLMAHALGYGTCYCGIYPTRSALFRENLNLPASIEPIGLIVVGKPLDTSTPTKPAKDRFDINAVHINEW